MPYIRLNENGRPAISHEQDLPQDENGEIIVPEGAVQISQQDLNTYHSNPGKYTLENLCLEVKQVTAEQVKVEVTSLRYEKETGGIVVGGVAIDTDRPSQNMLNGAISSMRNGYINSTRWKGADGTWTEVTLTELEPVAAAVAQHVDACFAAEEAHHAALDAGADPATYDITTGWPV